MVGFYKHRIRNQYKFAFIERDLKVSRLTATKYLDALAEQGFLQNEKLGARIIT